MMMMSIFTTINKIRTTARDRNTWKSYLGVQPSSRLALEASPNRKSCTDTLGYLNYNKFRNISVQNVSRRLAIKHVYNFPKSPHV